MQNKWFFLFGFVRIQVSESDMKRCIELLRKENVIARVSFDGRVDISIFHLKKARRILDSKVVFIEQNAGGLYAFYPLIKKHFAVPVAVLLFLAFYIFLSHFVFDVRIEGNTHLTKEEVALELSECGLSVGAKWKSLSFSQIENSVLEKSNHIAWLNIYKRGLVAYVTIKEKESLPQKEIHEGYANIVSAYDGVIEEISIRSGSTSLIVGQTVKKGDLLISSFDELGAPTYAEGEVYARIYGNFSIFIHRTDTEITTSEYKIIEKSVKFFNFSINILKNYGNLPQEYVIIEDRRRILLSKDRPLPITLCDTYAMIETKAEVVRTDEELIRLAKEAHESAMLSYLSSGELVFVRTEGEFTEDGYLMKSEICMLTQIGVTVPLPMEAPSGVVQQEGR